MAVEKVSYLTAKIFFSHPIMYVFEGLGTNTPFDVREYCLIFKDDMCEEWVDTEATREYTLKLIRIEKEKPGYFENLINSYEWRKEKFLNLVDELDRSDLAKKNDEELIAMLNTFMRVYVDQFCLPAITFMYADHMSNILLKKFSEKHENASELLSAVTNPSIEMFSNAERRELLELMCRMIEKFGNGLFKLPEEKIETKIKKDKLYEELVKHSMKYFWIDNNYRRAVVLGPFDFIRKMKDESLSFEHPKDELEEIKKIKEEAESKRKKYGGMLGDEEKTMAYLLSRGAEFQDERKKCNLIGDHIIQKFADEISRRSGITKELVANAKFDEIFGLLDGSITAEELEKRGKEFHTMYYKNEGNKTEIGFKKGRMHEIKEVKKPEMFTGTPASMGIAKGKVRLILSDHDFKKMGKGNILVSGMTRPDFVPVMKKAAAIVTDEGGLTCHAAVVSRELGVPCVVGTRIATAVLEDGDLIEVDGKKGTVKISK